MSLSNEITLCGLPAVQARFARDPASIKRLFFDEPTSRKLGAMCKALAAAKKVYRCVPPAELEKIAGTLHHGGVACVVHAPPLAAPSPREIAGWAAKREPLVVLDRIGNAHNLGAIARSAAYFGVSHLIIPAHPSAALPGEAAFRVAEGGMDHITVWRVPALPAFLGALKAAGYDVIGAATRGGAPVPRSASAKPVALVMGNEEQGLAPEVVKACSSLVTLAGTGKVESLNVSVAAAVLLHTLLAK
ncbi:MAG: RNA methyltransferase [Verrucomicrobia bacterium]|nr:RNA methyltransferase [Verrucomicrobiota bacterium]